MTTSAPGARVRKQKPRTAALRIIHDRLAALDLTVGDEVYGYYVEPLRCELAGFRAFRLTKCRRDQKPGEPSSYDLLIEAAPADEDHPRHSCECLGFLRWHRCKHVASLAALVAAGRI